MPVPGKGYDTLQRYDTAEGCAEKKEALSTSLPQRQRERERERERDTVRVKVRVKVRVSLRAVSCSTHQDTLNKRHSFGLYSLHKQLAHMLLGSLLPPSHLG